MRRLHGLDALRGIAALLVLFQHLLWMLSKSGHAWADTIITTVDLGKLGVALFFLISGFVIPFSFRGGVVAFAIGRAARLLPALWLSILFCVALGAQLHSGTQLFANAFMLTTTMGQQSISDPYWTLNWELYFYVLTGLAFAAGQLQRPRTFGLLALGFALASLVDPRFCYLLFMFAGTLLRMVLLEKREDAGLWLRVCLAMMIGAVSIWAVRGGHPPEFFLALALALPAFVLLWNRMTRPALLWLGSISYSLYLFHLPILTELGKAELPPLVFCALGVAIPLIVAALCYRFVEKPLIAWGKALAARSYQLRVA